MMIILQIRITVPYKLYKVMEIDTEKTNGYTMPTEYMKPKL